MAVVDVLDNTGSKVSQVELNDAIFNTPIKENVLHQVVVAQLSSKRAGTVAVKGRSDVVGSGRKLYRQKGTGRARKGDVKSPLLRGGGVVFGPVARVHTKKVMKKVGRAAIKMALTFKLKENQLIIINDFGLSTAKTKDFVKIIDSLNAASSLIVIPGRDEILRLSSRNLSGIKVLSYHGLNVSDILRYSKLIILESSLKGIERKLV